MKRPCKAFLFMAEQWDWDKNPGGPLWEPELWGVKMDENAHRVFLREVSFEVEVPDDFNPVPHQVAALEKEKRAALEAYQKRVGEINERLSKLLAIEHEEEIK